MKQVCSQTLWGWNVMISMNSGLTSFPVMKWFLLSLAHNNTPPPPTHSRHANIKKSEKLPSASCPVPLHLWTHIHYAHKNTFFFPSECCIQSFHFLVAPPLRFEQEAHNVCHFQVIQWFFLFLFLICTKSVAVSAVYRSVDLRNLTLNLAQKEFNTIAWLNIYSSLIRTSYTF